MHNGVDSPVEEAVFGLEPGDPEWTGGVVLATAAIRSVEAVQVGVFPGRVALPAPFCAGNAENIGKVALVPGGKRSRRSLLFRLFVAIVLLVLYCAQTV